ncbi:hypothetical protein MBLNU230_g8577t1 [Neophaeotheca triangularis]
MATIHTLSLTGGSDGDTSSWPTTGYIRNDDYFLAALGREWAKHRGADKATAANTRLSSLPTGYAGFEKRRGGGGGDSKHVDRYTYGHPSGRQFRSLAEFWPHFLALVEQGGSVGCECRLCQPASAKKRKSETGVGGSARGSSAAGTLAATTDATTAGGLRLNGLPAKVQSEQWAGGNFAPATLPLSEKDREGPAVDDEGTPDVARQLIEKLKNAANGPIAELNERVEEPLSPDRAVGYKNLLQSLKAQKKLPNWVPRLGEIVLFVPSLKQTSTLLWQNETWYVSDEQGELSKPNWQAGVVTQLPTESITELDLKTVDPGKKTAVNYHGFRIELLSDPANLNQKAFQTQYKFVMLHAIRPLSYWQYCFPNVQLQDLVKNPEVVRPTVQNALRSSTSFSLVGKYKFFGTWPDADMFYEGVYIGAELFLVGDTVLVEPLYSEQDGDIVTDIMKITSIRLKYIDLEEGYDNNYTTTPLKHALHICGRAYTTSAARAFNLAKLPIDPSKDPRFPQPFETYGPFYPVSDPNSPTSRLEVPFTRILSRVLEPAATNSWFTPATSRPSTSGFQAVNAVPSNTSNPSAPLTRPLDGLRTARSFATETDTRILRQAGKSWYWANTRIDALDLWEVNGKAVGGQDARRSLPRLETWRDALRVLEGDQGAREKLERQREVEARRRESEVIARARNAGGGSGMVALSLGASAKGGGGEEEEEEKDGDGDGDGGRASSASSAGSKRSRGEGGAMVLDESPERKKMALGGLDGSSEGEEDLAADQLVGEFIRGGIKGGR